jgi:hypothetical protein
MMGAEPGRPNELSPITRIDTARVRPVQEGGRMESSQRRRSVEPTDEWEQIELLCGWPEQRDYELIRPMVLFGAPADGRS